MAIGTMVRVQPHRRPATKGLEPFEVIGHYHIGVHWKTNFDTAFMGISTEAGVLEFGRAADVSEDHRLIVGLVTRPFDSPMQIAEVANYYGEDQMVTSPRAMVSLLREVGQKGNQLSYNMANLFFWRNGQEIRLMVLMGRKNGWYLRSYSLKDAPNFLTNCRVFISASVTA